MLAVWVTYITAKVPKDEITVQETENPVIQFSVGNNVILIKNCNYWKKGDEAKIICLDDYASDGKKYLIEFRKAMHGHNAMWCDGSEFQKIG